MMRDDDGVFILVLVRHADAGTPEAYARHRPGRPDSERPLTAEGRHQARRLAETLASVGPRPGLVLSSSWRRALQTAEPLARDAGIEVDTAAAFHTPLVDVEAAGTVAERLEGPLPWTPPLDPVRVRRHLIRAARHKGLCSQPAQAVETRARRGIFLFGHEPDLSFLLSAWLGVGAGRQAVVRFDKATFCQLLVPCSPSGVERLIWPGAELLALWPLGYGQSLRDRGWT